MYWEDIPYNEMNMIQLGDGLGYYGPLIVMACVIAALHTMPQYAIWYVIFVILNNLFVRGLKLVFRQERPSDAIPFSKYETYTHAEHYGMPSGHASSVAFSFVFLHLLKPHSWWLLVIGFIGTLTCIQRWKYRRHSFEQIIAGLIFGGLFAYGVQYMCKIIYRRFI